VKHVFYCILSCSCSGEGKQEADEWVELSKELEDLGLGEEEEEGGGEGGIGEEEWEQELNQMLGSHTHDEDT